MTVGGFLRMQSILEHGDEILVMEERKEPDYDGNFMRTEGLLSEFSDISDCMKYVTDPKYHLYVYKDEYTPYYELEELT